MFILLSLGITIKTKDNKVISVIADPYDVCMYSYYLLKKLHENKDFTFDGIVKLLIKEHYVLDDQYLRSVDKTYISNHKELFKAVEYGNVNEDEYVFSFNDEFEDLAINSTEYLVELYFDRPMGYINFENFYNDDNKDYLDFDADDIVDIIRTRDRIVIEEDLPYTFDEMINIVDELSPEDCTKLVFIDPDNGKTFISNFKNTPSSSFVF